MRAVVIMPRSPTMTTRSSSKRPHHRLHGLGEGAGVGGVAGKDVDRDRPALGVGQQPVGDLPFLPSRK